MNSEIPWIHLRDCFVAGYTMPQFCIEHKIERPLFVGADGNDWRILWEIFVQFVPYKNLSPVFSTVNGDAQSIRLSPGTLFDAMEIRNFSDVDVETCDKIFFMSARIVADNFKDAINFEDLLSFFIIHTYVEIPMLHFLQRHPHVKLFLTNFTIIEQSPHNTAREENIIAERKRLAQITAELNQNLDENIKTPYDFLGYTNQQLRDILNLTKAKNNPDGSTILEDSNNPLVQIVNGRRRVANQPDNFTNRIYFMGGCSHLGVGAPFDKTIPSFLQEMLNANNLPYRVENVSQFFTYRYQDILYNLANLPFDDGDIVFVFCDNFTSKIIPTFDVSATFHRPHNYGEVFVDTAHVNELGYKALAEKFFGFLTQNNFFKGVNFNYPAPPPPPRRYGIPHEIPISTASGELENYKHTLRAKRLPIGAIVMNCNPFTLGHEYLIEYAARKVARLYIFVVEEDKSEFAFADRFKMVKAGVKKFSNVEVIPSGKFIISQQTFSGYFNKTELQNAVVDSSEDVEIFAREIAPVLGINIRFAGEEPEDAVTRQYNETMKIILPRYGIDFREIPRRKVGDNVISAKAVRDALKVGDFDKIRKLVPRTTMNFLREKFTTTHYNYRDYSSATKIHSN